MELFLDLLKQYGPFVAAIIFCIWRDWKREHRLNDRIDELQAEQRDVILPLVKECAEVITLNTETMGRNTQVMQRLDWALERMITNADQSKPESEN